MFMKAKDQLYETITKEVFKRATIGTLTLTVPSGEVMVFEGADQAEPKVDLHFHDWQVLKRSLSRGDIGFGETYIEGLWTTSDLPLLMTYMVHNMELLSKVIHASPVMRRVFQLVNWFRRNNKQNSLANIRAHYDVGNDFYKLWLDDTMTYSSAIFDSQKSRDLVAAQTAKYQRILDKISDGDSANTANISTTLPKASNHILEIGCGWGGFAEQAAKSGHKVTGLTLSNQQLAFAKQRATEKNFESLADLRLQDYRDITGSYDAIVSIEMLEAVGEQYWPTYFNTLKKRLKKGGKAVIQTITIDHSFFEDYKRRSDFIRHYTFPGGLLPSMPKMKEEFAKAGLVCKEVFAFGKDYAHTLTHWFERLNDKKSEIRSLGYTDQFIAAWQFYLACCIGAFAAGRTDVVQLELAHA